MLTDPVQEVQHRAVAAPGEGMLLQLDLSEAVLFDLQTESFPKHVVSADGLQLLETPGEEDQRSWRELQQCRGDLLPDLRVELRDFVEDYQVEVPVGCCLRLNAEHDRDCNKH